MRWMLKPFFFCSKLVIDGGNGTERGDDSSRQVNHFHYQLPQFAHGFKLLKANDSSVGAFQMVFNIFNSFHFLFNLEQRRIKRIKRIKPEKMFYSASLFSPFSLFGGLPRPGFTKSFKSPSGINQMLPAMFSSSLAFGSKPRLIHERTETELTPNRFPTSDAFRYFSFTNK